MEIPVITNKANSPSKKKLGIVVKLEPASSAGGPPSFVGNIILKKMLLDDEGNICLTAPMGLTQMLEAIDELKADLDHLSNQAILWLADSIPLLLSAEGTDFWQRRLTQHGPIELTGTRRVSEGSAAIHLLSQIRQSSTVSNYQQKGARENIASRG